MIRRLMKSLKTQMSSHHPVEPDTIRYRGTSSTYILHEDIHPPPAVTRAIGVSHTATYQVRISKDDFRRSPRSHSCKMVFDIVVFTLKFCRVCGFLVRVWESYRTSRSFWYGYESVTELAEVPGIVARAYRTNRSSGHGYECPTELTEVPGTCTNALQNLQKFRVRVIPG